MQEQAKAYQFNPDNIMPPEVQRQLLQLLRWRDDIYRDILKKIEMIPGLESLIDALTNALNACEAESLDFLRALADVPLQLCIPSLHPTSLCVPRPCQKLFSR